MQFRKIFPLLSFALFLLFSQASNAQVIRDNDQGERIVVYSDGSWRYFNENDPRDQALWEKQMKPKKEQPRLSSTAADRSSKNQKKKTAKQEESYIDQLANKKKKQKGNANKVPTKTASGPSQREMNKKEAIRYAEQISAEEARAIKAEEEASLNRFFLEEELDELLNSDGDYSKDKEKQLRSRVKQAKQDEKAAKASSRAATKRADIAAKLIDMDPVDRSSTVAKLEEGRTSGKVRTSSPKDENYAQQEEVVKAIKPKKKRQNETVSVSRDQAKKNRKKNGKKDSRMAEQTNVPKNRRTRKAKTEPSVKETKRSENKLPRSRTSPTATVATSDAKFVSFTDVLRNPPAPECNLSFDGIDDFTGKRRRDVAAGQLFTYTSDQLKPYLKEKAFITCNAHISILSGGYQILFMEFIIASENAQREFGILEKGGQLILTLIDGSKIQLSNNKNDPGTLDAFNKVVKYKGQYLIGSEQAKALSKKEVDTARVVWGTGFEDYDIFELDFFIDQFACLESHE